MRPIMIQVNSNTKKTKHERCNNIEAVRVMHNLFYCTRFQCMIKCNKDITDGQKRLWKDGTCVHGLMFKFIFRKIKILLKLLLQKVINIQALQNLRSVIFVNLKKALIDWLLGFNAHAAIFQPYSGDEHEIDNKMKWWWNEKRDGTQG